MGSTGNSSPIMPRVLHMRPGRLVRFVVPACLIAIYFYFFAVQRIRLTTPGLASNLFPTPPSSTLHPIDILVAAADQEFESLLAKESHDVETAAAAYRLRRSRHPPPGFGDWFQFAKERGVVMVEDFWDQIYHDLEPFWAVDPAVMRKEAYEYEMTINVRDGVAYTGSNWFWTQIWLGLIATISHLLPDMDLALNAMDEPRIVAPWEDIDKLVSEASKRKTMVEPSKAITEYQKLDLVDDSKTKARKIKWEKTLPYWRIARRGCAPGSLARKNAVVTEFDSTPNFSHELAGSHMYQGFVSNFTKSTELCHQPDLAELNGIFVEPLSVSATNTLFPLFGGSKLAVNNEILLPAPIYWSNEERFTGANHDDSPWANKRDEAIWRGVATGGKNKKNTWRAFQRHRFVAMNNATKIAAAEQRGEKPLNFQLPPAAYGLAAQQKKLMGAWVDSWANVSFVDLMCWPTQEDYHCTYTDEHFVVTPGVKLGDQFDYKYLPDIDGNSFSGRYRGFLMSTSLPIKSTVWREWHDSRLLAWRHFVPMDNRYIEWWAIMEYFLGYQGEKAGHDAVAERLARQGKEWAEKVLRKEDMQVYVFRLLLEYARVSDQRREGMAWVDDLKS